MVIDERATRYFNSGYNCAESVLLAVNKNIDPTSGNTGTSIPRMATGFGGGIAKNGDTCGAVTGAVIAISLALGRDTSGESRDRCYDAVDRFYNDFVRVFGTCKCRELTGLDLKNQAEMDAYRAKIHADVCSPIVAWAAKRSQQIIQSDD
jgi:C_GCAxxG_C_C family probable redox protein